MVDPKPGMLELARRQIERRDVEAVRWPRGSEVLPLGKKSFVELAIQEVYRVLKPGDSFLVAERSQPDVSVQKWQRRLNWLQRLLADNCRLARNIRQPRLATK